MASFYFDDETGEIIYEPSPDENVVVTDESPGDSEPEQGDVEGLPGAESVTDVDEEIREEIEENGNYVDSLFDSGVDESVTLEDETVLSPSRETVVVNDSDNAVPVVLSDDITLALTDALTPATGTLGSTTLEYFDRIVSAFPYDYAYVAYRTNSTNSAEGVLYYGDDYTINDNTIVFDDAVAVRVYRSGTGSTAYTYYVREDVGDVSLSLSHNSTLVYYSNIKEGFPLLGGYERPFNISPFIVVGLLSAMAVAILAKIFNRK